MGNKLGLSQQTPPPVSPNAEDLSLILGSMARGRSFSTTTGPKPQEINMALMGKDRSNSPGSNMVIDTTMVQRRKKSVPHTQREKWVCSLFFGSRMTANRSVGSSNNINFFPFHFRDSSSAEEFFIEVILQRHARRLLQEKKLEALGYMSAALDFHLVKYNFWNLEHKENGNVIGFLFFFIHRLVGWHVKKIERLVLKILLQP